MTNQPHRPSGVEIRFKRGTDGGDAFTIVRPDGSHTRQRDRTGGFFAPHDLTHWVVETRLRFRRGFYGLVAEGWDLSDFGHPWPRGPMPPEAVVPEAIVGLFDQEQAAGTCWTAEEFNTSLSAYLAPLGLTAPELTDEVLMDLRQRRAVLVARWKALGPGETLTLPFIPGGEPDDLTIG